MRPKSLWQFVLMLGLPFLIGACETMPVIDTPIPTVLVSQEDLQAITPIPTVVIPTVTATSTQSPTPIPDTVTPTFTPDVASDTPPTDLALSPTVPPTDTPAVTVASVPVADHYWLQRPIAQEDGMTHWIDRTYPYGGTQFGEREVHLGVEFVNSRFTPVIAAADGIVLYAGADTETVFGPVPNYYGNLVVIEHYFLAPEGGSIYTLYGHLQDIAVSTGQSISTGDRLGRIGDTGIAVGPHLHFEIRVADPHDYRSTRNPDLWLLPYPQYGTIAGYVDAAPGTVIHIRSVQLQRETYTYADDLVNADHGWMENFTSGDLPAGIYEVFISDGNGRKLASETVTVASRATTWITLTIDGDE